MDSPPPPPPPPPSGLEPPPPPPPPTKKMKMEEPIGLEGKLRKLAKDKPSSAQRKDPPSLQELLQEWDEEKAARAKPVFIPKKQREKAAADQAAAAAAAAKKASAQMAAQDKFGPVAVQKAPQSASSAWDKATQDYMTERYMGPTQVSKFSALKKRKRTTDKKFSFDWPASDDTSNDTIPLHGNSEDAESDRAIRQKIQTLLIHTDRNTQQTIKTLLADADRATLLTIRGILTHDGESGPQRACAMLEQKEAQKRRQAQRDGFGMPNWQEKSIEKMKPRDWRMALSHYNIAVKGGNLPNPARSWRETGLPDNLLNTVQNKVGYKEPSAIQRMAIPIALQGRDVIGIAETGSGKTAAFALPLLTYIESLPPINSNNPGPYALILAPTRELAQQIESEIRKLAQGTGYRVVSITGGHSVEEQSFNLRDGAEIIVATPGRLVDMINRRILVLNTCCYIIMDEADRMIDMGFQDPLERILDALPVTNEKPDNDDAEDAAAMTRTLSDLSSMNLTRYRQTHLYSATLSTPIQRLARQYTRRAAEIQIGEANTGVETVTQHLEFISGEDRRKRRLADLLHMQAQYPPPMIVFVNVKRSCDALARDVRGMGRSAVTLHGDKTQEQREDSLARLRAGEVDVLVATDLAARGIDVPDVSLVVNFQLPSAIEPYLHRIGRTGRAGKSGTAISFISNDDAEIMYDLKGVLQRSSLSKVPEELRKHPAAQQRQGRGQRKIEL